MAIEKTIFLSSTLADAAQEVYTWLTANASDLFDSIEVRGNVITCSKNEKKVLVLFDETYSHVQHYKVFDANQSLVTTSFVRHADSTNFESAYKTSYGIVLVACSEHTSRSRHAVIFISTDENSELVMCGMNPSATPSSDTNGSPSLWIIAPESEATTNDSIKLGGNNITLAQSYWKTEKTAFSEVVTQKGTKTPHLFYLPFTQYPAQVAEINDGSKRYVTDGFFALEE